MSAVDKLDGDFITGILCMALLIGGNAIGGITDETSAILIGVAVTSFSRMALRKRRESMCDDRRRSKKRKRRDDQDEVKPRGAPMETAKHVRRTGEADVVVRSLGQGGDEDEVK